MPRKKKIEEVEDQILEMADKVDQNTLEAMISEYYNSMIEDPIFADRWKKAAVSGKIVSLTDEVKEAFAADGYEIPDDESIAAALESFVVSNNLSRNVSKGWEKIIETFGEYCYEDEEFVASTCNTASAQLKDQFRISMDDPSDPIRNGFKMIAVTFIYTYEEIINLLKSKREKHPTYLINIAGRLEVGYSNRDDDDDEKNGNIMIYLKNIDHKTTVSDDYEAKMTGSTKEFVTNWNQENMTYNPEDAARIAAATKKKLKTIDIELGSDELIFPIFVTVYECIIHNIKVWRVEHELDMVKINWCNCFSVTAMEQDDGVDKIILTPSIEGKTDLKSDKYATSIYD